MIQASQPIPQGYIQYSGGGTRHPFSIPDPAAWQPNSTRLKTNGCGRVPGRDSGSNKADKKRCDATTRNGGARRRDEEAHLAFMIALDCRLHSCVAIGGRRGDSGAEYQVDTLYKIVETLFKLHTNAGIFYENLVVVLMSNQADSNRFQNLDIYVAQTSLERVKNAGRPPDQGPSPCGDAQGIYI